jgi:hypothetical protein
VTFKPGVVTNPAGNPAWKKGIRSPNPQGRKKGTVDGKKLQERIQEALLAMAQFEATDQRSFVQILRDFAHDETIKPALRIAAAAAGAPYEQGKIQSVPGPQYLHTAITVPSFQSIEQAEAFLHELSQREGRKELESQSVATIAARIQAWINNKRSGQELELKRLNASVSTSEQTIHISGGLPSLPGCNIITPQLNGHAGHGLLEHEPAVPSNGHDPSPAPASPGAPPDQTTSSEVPPTESVAK